MKASGRSQHLKVIGATLLAAVLVFSGGQALHAEEWPPSIEDAIAVLENVSPRVVAETSDGSHVAIEDTRLVEGEAAYYLEHGGDVLGTVFKPWAVDAAGNSVPTSYS
ncbi:MAG: hypothetical protein B5766_12390 [Candidatus Lumbricidophila eiseniae]|uniref:Uncharacterized protein n=1 Tax=Candidatus Lumbricidiphila eiseniae TaxID=1969409 RepID=A0A2A6FMX0_9MICO|nr:MAG: hypothetical protein B5766_12390 [Candidatus Lumbricidophila eiseniae]